MNLSCSGGGLTERGCLFFKVSVTGERDQKFGNVTNGKSSLKYSTVFGHQWILYSLNLHLTAKFNCTVPGTLHDFAEDCNIIAMVKTPGAETTSIVTAMVTTAITITSESIHIATNHSTTYTAISIPLLVSLIGDAIIAVILAISTVA